MDNFALAALAAVSVGVAGGCVGYVIGVRHASRAVLDVWGKALEYRDRTAGQDDGEGYPVDLEPGQWSQEWPKEPPF